jgi:hypothetical protein
MKMRVVMSGSSSGLKNNNISDVELKPAAGIENIFETGMSCSDERAEQFRITKKPCSQELRHGQDYMSICYAGQKSSGDKVCPSVGVNLGTGKAKAGFAGKCNSTCLPAKAASVLDKTHLFRITAVDHFLDGVVIIRAVKALVQMLKRIPVIKENLFKCVFVKAFHGCSLQTTITELAGQVEKVKMSRVCVLHGKTKKSRRRRLI